ncbi:MAG: glycosyltransferase family 2 protein [Solirubrobacterales bacterium]
MQLVMTLKVRDEADILEDNLRYHRALGVDFFVVTDNGSVDGTSEILERYVNAGLAHVLRVETGTLRNDEEHWTTRMARLAATEFEADWVFHDDADELWWPVQGTLKQAFEAIPEQYGSVVAPRGEYVARPDAPGPWFERMVYREALGSLQPKAAHRADPDAVVISQTHEVVSAGPDRDLWHAMRPPGRMLHRGTRATSDEQEENGDRPEVRLVWAPTHPLRIFHFPLRSFEQFRKRTEIFLRHGGWRDTGRFRRLRYAYEQGRLEELYAELVWDDSRIEEGLGDAELVRDDRFAKLLPQCPDPFSGAPAGSVRVAPSAEDLEREQAEVDYDAMRLMSRTQRFTMLQLDRSRSRLDELRTTLDEVRGKLNRTLGRRLLKLTRRLRQRKRTDELAAPASAPPEDVSE